MKRYEGLFILNNMSKEEGIKEVIDAITTDITAVGGKVETVQKMDKRPFSRVADKRNSSGFYVNFIFEASPATAASCRPALPSSRMCSVSSSRKRRRSSPPTSPPPSNRPDRETQWPASTKSFSWGI